jgi:hypothetical protein
MHERVFSIPCGLEMSISAVFGCNFPASVSAGRLPRTVACGGGSERRLKETEIVLGNALVLFLVHVHEGIGQ